MERKAFEASSAGRVLYVPGGDYWAYVSNPLPPSLTWTPNLVSDLSAADRALGELSGLGRVMPDPHLLVTPFVRREAVLSSQIEGTQASLFDLYAYEVSQLPIFERPADVREVHNCARAGTWVGTPGQPTAQPAPDP